MQKISIQAEFDAAPDVIVAATMAPDFLTYVAANMDDINKVTIEEETDIGPGKKRIRMRYEGEPDLPGFIRKIVPSGSKGMVSILDLDTSDNSHAMELVLDFLKDKFSSSGRGTFTQKEGKWIYRIELDLEVKIKLIGAKAEKAVAAMMEKSLKGQMELLQLFLKEPA